MTTGRIVVPPRPNPGPEPLPRSDVGRFAWGAGILLVPLLIVAVLRLRRRGRPRPSMVAPDRVDPPVASLEARVRERLEELFGEGWPTMTVEEAAASGRLAERFGPEAEARIVDYLRRAERVRCSGRGDDGMEEAEAWIVQFLDFIGAARATSMMTGR